MAELGSALQQGNDRFREFSGEIEETKELALALRLRIAKAEGEMREASTRFEERAKALGDLVETGTEDLRTKGELTNTLLEALDSSGEVMTGFIEGRIKEVEALPETLDEQVGRVESEVDGHVDAGLTSIKALRDLAESSRDRIERSISETSKNFESSVVQKLQAQVSGVDTETTQLSDFLDKKFAPAVKDQVTELASRTQGVIEKATSVIEECERRVEAKAEDAAKRFAQAQQQMLDDLDEKAKTLQQALGRLGDVAQDLRGDWDGAKDSLQSGLESTQTGFQAAVGTLEKIKSALDEIL